jgi:hypothetical protein
MYDKLIKPFPELPITVTAIAADLDPEWVGTQQSREAARELFALPQVQAGSHTYSHPFEWSFFADGNAEKERPYLSRYPFGRWDQKKDLSSLLSFFSGIGGSHDVTTGESLEAGYFVPRAFANERFNLQKEIGGSVKEISKFLPPGKKVEILSWPGDCVPFEEAVRLTREAGLRNINGGDTRFDPDYPSYASVAPVGRQVGKERQIYSSNSNENTYTALWTAKYHSFQYLKTTFDNTNTPIRVEPANIYYHVYSAERTASLNAVLSDIHYVLNHPVIPITAAQFSDIAQGFYTTHFALAGPSSWKVLDRGALQTIRFDNATLQAVDMARSPGVVGQRHFQGSLYVYLDEAAKEPVITLKRLMNAAQETDSPEPYLLESRWRVTHLRTQNDAVHFTAQGWGKGEMAWRVPRAGRWSLRDAQGHSFSAAAVDGVVHITADMTAHTPVEFSLTRTAP